MGLLDELKGFEKKQVPFNKIYFTEEEEKAILSYPQVSFSAITRWMNANGKKVHHSTIVRRYNELKDGKVL